MTATQHLLPHPKRQVACLNWHTKHYILSPWIDGRSLTQFWEDNPKPILDNELVKEVLLQLQGIAEKVFSIKTGPRCYFSLESDTILRVEGPGRLGTLIFSPSDSVLHKTHHAPTQARAATMTIFRCQRYRPPEGLPMFEYSSRQGRVWSMGCLSLEFAIWLLYGWEELKQFRDEIKLGGFYIEVEPGIIKLHQSVKRMLDRSLEEVERGHLTALGGLLRLIQSKALVTTPKDTSGAAKLFSEDLYRACSNQG